MEFLELDEARKRGGLRLVTVAGVPSPWSEAAKGILLVKRIPTVGVRMEAGRPEVPAWTGQASAPVAMYEEEPPRGGWAEILLLAERLAPEPRLIPADTDERAELFGLSHEICGEMGLGWARRLERIHTSFESDGAEGFPLPVAKYLAPKYGYRPDSGSVARGRVVELLEMLGRRLQAQRRAGSRYYLGDELTAVDIYSATFAGMLQPLPPELLPMPEPIRAMFSGTDPDVEKALDPILIEHRDHVYREYLELPVLL